MQLILRQPKNLKKIVTGLLKVQEGEEELNPGCFKCDKKCHACRILTEGKHFYSTNTGRRYDVKQKVSCDSSFVIYLGTCLKCSGQYVGKSTQQFKRRHSGHLCIYLWSVEDEKSIFSKLVLCTAEKTTQ